jgi:hypothetical protein
MRSTSISPRPSQTPTGELTDPARFYRPPHGVLVMGRAGWRPVGVVGVHRLYRDAAFVVIEPYHDLGVPGVVTTAIRVPGRTLTG